MTILAQSSLKKSETEPIKKVVVTLFEDKDQGAYRQFLQARASIGRVPFEYTLEWKDIIQKHFGFTPYHLLARNPAEKIVGILPLFKAESIFGKRIVSTPYAIFTGILADDEGVARELLTFAKQLAQEQQVDFLELREKPVSYGRGVHITDLTTLNNISPMDNISSMNDISTVSSISSMNYISTMSYISTVKNVFNFSLHLSEHHEDVWKKLPKGSVRWGITKAKRSGLTVQSGNTKQDLDTFYDLFLQTRKWRGVPAYPYGYFKEIIAVFGDQVKIYTSFFEGKPAASIFLIYHHKEVRYAFAGAVHKLKIMALQPYHLIIWEAITDACRNGYTLFNFGGATLATNEGGLYEFKRKWADTVEEVPYYYFLNKGGKIPTPDQSPLLRIASKVWAMLPLSLIKLLSPKVIRQFV